ncbi:MAG: GNAT family N-acetyltransferase [Anaeroplasmataceae bacterium]|nr:GNAT family N-acetyltransferase [Anaeroplasmataceae bacterium]
MDIHQLSKKYQVMILQSKDVEDVLELCLENTLYYEYCPPLPTKESILEDMTKLPPRTTEKDKFYLGFYEKKKLIAVMDLILGYPNEHTAFIGFFMLRKSLQGKGIGSSIIDECFSYLHHFYSHIRLGYVLGNLQSEAFWLKQGFQRTGLVLKEENYSIVVLEHRIGGEIDGH